ncbi:Far1 [Hordeum vulgare]|nr:Far1 [Hordeum vulgare]
MVDNHGDWAEKGNVRDDDIEENNSEVSNEDYISQLISGSHNAYDYYGESDVETDLEDETVDAPISGESQSSVNMSEVTEDEGKENVQDSTHAHDQRDMFMNTREMTFVSIEDAFVFYNSYAKENGFSIRNDKVRIVGREEE